MDILLVVIGAVWLGGTWLRSYRQAHYYQIEEYKSRRYVRWLLQQRGRWLPSRPVIAALVGIGLGLLLGEAPGSILPGIIGVLAAGVAIWQPRPAEVKKPFRATARAKRLLGAAFVVAALLLVIYLWLITLVITSETLAAARVMLAGLLLFLSAPRCLIVGNLLMTPVEALFRRRFVAQARGILERVHPTVIGITGSYGKTTTKTYLAEILNGRYRTYPTPKSYNTIMGVCLAINQDLADNYSVDYFIAEMGAYVPGEIAGICDLTHPTISIVVEVGPQHLERFGSLENTAKAKYEIIKALPPDGVGVFNWDNPYVRQMAERGYPETRLTVSKTVDPAAVPENSPRFIASDIQETLDGLRFTVTDHETGQSEPFSTALLGQHNITNILLATAVAVHEGMSLKEVAFRVRGLQPPEHRLVRQVTAQGITLINDAYSANPVGAAQALRVLGMHTGGARLLITPGMIELGDLMEQENYKLGQTAAQHASDVFLVGREQTAPVKAGLLDAGFPAERLRVVDTLSEAVAWYQTNLQPGDTVLFLNDLPDTY
ncbi:MAG: UDP-N-acetylmuramoyl-tripeptide--D-alanyl-D-alanine ligase [Anaerolineaceae bacterium]|nr:UDP-N-acetylmuramoyl-tripeptide--D-alanyl-D-alanine ligase [Anaerolineaceae bacterium]